MKSTGAIIAAFLGGAVVGGIVALLLAPESGADMRKKVTDFLEKKGIKLSKEDLDAFIHEINPKKETE